MAETLPILVLVRDLMFQSKISATARAANIATKIVRDPAAIANQDAPMLIADLNQEGAIAAAGAWVAATGKSAVGFVSHVDAAAIAQARAAGIQTVMARSAFVQQLSALLASAINAPTAKS
ncbi:MAG TPA: hypothetical protein VGG19_16160 [Tepidisphaeraceae bacterium]